MEETIRSILRQTYPHLEYIVVDGGSTDNTLSVLQSYNDVISKWVSEPDDGQSAAINKGWRMSQGDVLAWLNSDDLYEPEAVERAVALLELHPEALAVYGDAWFIDADGRIIKRHRAKPFDLSALLLEGNYIPQPAVFVRRSVLEKVGWLAEELHFSMDYDFWLRIGMHGELLYVPEVWAQARRYQQSKTERDQYLIWQDREKVLMRALSQPDCPSSLRKQSRFLWATFHARAAGGLANLLEVRCSLYHFLRMACNRPDFLFRVFPWLSLTYGLSKGIRRKLL